MKLRLGGRLACYERGRRGNLEVALEPGTRLGALLSRLAIPRAEVALVVINGQLAVEDDPELRDSDDVRLYPPMGGGAR